MYCIAEQLCKDDKYAGTINGVSISPKKSFCILKIWNSNCEINSNSLIADIKHLNKDETLYSNHEFNIKKDTNKNKKKSYNFEDGFTRVRGGGRNKFRY